jgi:phosphohistidine phosphatase SixA
MLWKLIPICTAIVAAFVASAHSQENAGAPGLLHAGAHSVILMRHRDAPGDGEPPSFRLDDCSTQRNLSDKGREQARALGAMLRERGIPVAKVVSSQWCRARETAELMQVGKVEHEPAFDNLSFNKAREKDLTERARAFVAAWHGPGVLIVVTHDSNLKALAGSDAARIGMVLADAAEGGLRFHPLTSSVPAEK